MNKLSVLGFAALTLAPAFALAGSISKTHTFSAGGTASASQVNANFDQLFAEMNAKETRITALESGGTVSPWTVGSGLIHYTGQVGIGTSSPEGEFDVRGLLSAGAATTGISNPNAVAVLRSFTNPHLILEKSGTNVGGIAVDNADLVMGSELGDLVFRTGVDYNGDFTSTGGQRMRINGSNQMILNNTGAILFGASTVCTVAGCSATPSDRRLKENIRPLEGSLAKILLLRGVSYDWRDRQMYRDGSRIGFVAQELEETFPEVVRTDAKSGLKSVSYGHLLAPAIEAIKELYRSLTGVQSEVDKLKAENTELRIRVEAAERETATLKARMDKIESSQEKNSR